MEKDFWLVGQILMDNHKLVMISIFVFLTMKKMQFLFLFFLMKNMLGKVLGFGRMKTLFFEKGNWFKSFWGFFLKYFEENQIF